ncbi:hypothetical protein Vadar_000276 [Vaccinium darrowii]|uniref:Uncharacterized protein n=1 Tax=Vaccinium darrowii TaxID=229202 RepID=A0ACB7YSA7_9ERIC|nr:hypothetical protein Vadar_000276 [Vaccinium darrowii]
MATASVAFKSREDHRNQMELEEARKAALAPAEVDEDGKEINPHIPQYMSSAPWNLRIREDTAKYLLNPDVNSAHYDPKTRSMREDPLPDMDSNGKFYAVSIVDVYKLCFLNFLPLLFLSRE